MQLPSPPLSPHTRQVQQPEACIYLAVHPAQSALLNDEVAGRLQEMRAEVTLLDVIVLIAAVSGPGPGSDGEGHQCFCKFELLENGGIQLFTLHVSPCTEARASCESSVISYVIVSYKRMTGCLSCPLQLNFSPC